jgi:hypothetical protein
MPVAVLRHATGEFAYLAPRILRAERRGQGDGIYSYSAGLKPL